MKRTKTVQCLPAALLALSSFSAPVFAQIIQPVPLVRDSAALPPGTNCTVEALNIGGIVKTDGSVFVMNVPANQGAFRLRATCKDALGATLNGQSELVNPIPGGLTAAGFMDFGTVTPVPKTLQLSSSPLNFSGLSTTQQLTVQAMLADGSIADVTLSTTGSSYRTSNPATAKIGPNGLITAVGNGTAIVSAVNEGSLGMATVRVRSAALVSLNVVPANVTMSINPAFNLPPVPLKTIGTLADNELMDLTRGTSGITYASSDQAIAAVNADGAIAALSAGTTNITVKDLVSNLSKTVPVTVSIFNPRGIKAFDTPGFAYNCDIDGTLVYVADGPGGLRIMNARTGVTVGIQGFPNKTAYDVRVADKLAAVALGISGFALVDVTDPSKPVLRSITATGSNVPDLAISGNRVYVASASNLRIYDISNPNSPVLLGTQALGGTIAGVAADTTRNLVVAATTPSTIKVVQINGPPPWPIASLPLGGGNADDIVLLGTSAYVANLTGGIREIDVTNPANPQAKVASTLTFDATGVAVRQTTKGTLVAAADDYFFNAVPLFNTRLNNTYNINFQNMPGIVKNDANSTGIALGHGFGVVTVGSYGIQVFETQQLDDNSGIAPTVSLTNPVNGTSIVSGDPVLAEATAVDDVGVAFVEFVVNNAVVDVDGDAPFNGTFVGGTKCSTQTVEAFATDNNGNTGISLKTDVKVKCGDGQMCTTNADCESGNCGGSICQPCSAGNFVSCAALHTTCPGEPSGTYSLDPDGPGGLGPFLAYCEMKIGGGGWTLAAKLSNQDTKNWVNGAASWTTTNSYGSYSNISTGQDAKSPAFGTLPVNEILLTDVTSLANDLFAHTTGNCIGNQPLSTFFTPAMVGYPTFTGQTEYKKCTILKNYVPAWTTEPDWLGQGSASPSNSLNNGYLVVAKSDEFDSYAVISFYADGPVFIGPDYLLDSMEFEADVGLGVSQELATPFGTLETQQDFGGPSSCSNTDTECATEYPQTVLLFAR